MPAYAWPEGIYGSVARYLGVTLLVKRRLLWVAREPVAVPSQGGTHPGSSRADSTQLEWAALLRCLWACFFRRLLFYRTGQKVQSCISSSSFSPSTPFATEINHHDIRGLNTVSKRPFTNYNNNSFVGMFLFLCALTALGDCALQIITKTWPQAQSGTVSAWLPSTVFKGNWNSTENQYTTQIIKYITWFYISIRAGSFSLIWSDELFFHLLVMYQCRCFL